MVLNILNYLIMCKIQSLNRKVKFLYDANKIHASFYKKAWKIFVLSDRHIVPWRHYFTNANMALMRTFELGAEYETKDVEIPEQLQM
jgi:hypothetical protein